MHPATIELMRQHVRIIYRAATGAELNESDDVAEERAPAQLDEEVERHFAELDALARSNPTVGERVPPFSFTPLLDVIDAGAELIVEIVAPGVEPADVQIETRAHELTISGVRRGELSNGRVYVHAEIPRGPFRRTIRLPCAVEPHPDLDARHGELVLRLRKT